MPKKLPTSLSPAPDTARTRHSIVAAALEEFAKNGFSGTRMDSIAQSAGVAKGTIYLHFRDKESLFAAIVEQEIQPAMNIQGYFAQDGSGLAGFVQTKLPAMLDQILEPKRRALLMMLIGEAGRFPKLAEIYYRLVIEPGAQAIRSMAQQAQDGGAPANPLLAEFPMLLVAPMILGMVWTNLFAIFEPLDVHRMAQAYFGRLLAIPGAVAAAPSRALDL